MNYWIVAASRSSDPESLAKYVDTIIHSMLSDQVAKMSVGEPRNSSCVRRSNGDEKASGTRAEQRKCFYCKQEGHWIKQCPKKLTMECFSCGRLGHTAKRCPNGSESIDRKSTRLNSSHVSISYAVFCLKKR